MQIKIIAVGKIKEQYFMAGIREYLKRLSRDVKMEIIEVFDEKIPENLSKTELNLIKEKEGRRISRYLKTGTYLIALDRLGRQLSSPELSKMLEDLGVRGRVDLTFLIGGSLGLADSLLKKADFKLSFGAMTYPHQLMRLILMEQLYRSFKIMQGHPYHK